MVNYALPVQRAGHLRVLLQPGNRRYQYQCNFHYFIYQYVVSFYFQFFIKEEKEKQAIEASSYKNLGDVLKNPALIFLLCAVLIISAGTSTIWYFYSTYMKVATIY